MVLVLLGICSDCQRKGEGRVASHEDAKTVFPKEIFFCFWALLVEHLATGANVQVS